MTDDRKTVAEMIGESLREAAVLVGVFAPLERIVTDGSVALTLGEVGIIVALVGALLVTGIAIEVVRQ